MDYTTKVLYQSNQWYNDGLSKAKIHDMSGAILSLKKSLQFNRMNIAARNLLGLVYYGRGDVIEALKEWVLSKHFQNEDNIANYFIREIRKNPSELEEINQAVKYYNQSLIYARQGNEDLAIIQLKRAVSMHPTYVKAYQLLALIYLKTEQYAAARQILRTVHRLDITDELTLRYMHELSEIRKEQPIKTKKPEKLTETVSYSIGNETIIQPAVSAYKKGVNRKGLMQMGIGFLAGVVLVGFLVMPTVNTSRQKKFNKKMVAFSDQIAEQEAQISALKTELETYRASSEEAESSQASTADVISSYDHLMNAAIHYKAKDLADTTIIEELLEVDPNALGEDGKAQYETMTQALFPDRCKTLYNQAKASFEVMNYEYVVTFLDQVIAMDPGYASGEAMLLLAQTYEAQGNQDKANLLYQKLIEDYKDTAAATSAKEALDEQNNPDNTEGGDGTSDTQ